MDSILKVALFQMNITWQDVELNLRRVESMVRSTDVDLVVLPEMFATGFSMSPTRDAQSMDQDIVNRMSALAVECGRAIVGSVAISIEGRYVNRLFFWKPDGTAEYYDKRHTFRMGGEDLVYEKGRERLVVGYRGFRICPLICYDLRFPVWSRNRDDYDLMIYVACWPEQRRYAWNTLLRARAIENVAYCIGANRCGSEPGLSYCGDSVVLDFKGLELPKVTNEINPMPYVNEAVAEIDRRNGGVADSGLQSNSLSGLLSDLHSELSSEECVIEYILSLKALEQFRARFPVHLDADQFDLR